MNKELAKLLNDAAELRGSGQRLFNRSINNRFAVVKAQSDETVINIYDEIGFWGITASQIRRQLDTVTTPRLKVRINSPGGDVFDGIAISNDIKNHPAQVEVEITGIAASAASIIAMAGDTICMASNSFMMIHNVWGVVIGNKHTLREMADLCDKFDAALAVTYAERTGLDEKTLSKMLDAETWLSAQEAVDQKFADKIIGAPDEPQALFDLSGFDSVPAALKRRIEAGLRDEGFSHSEAKAAVAEGFGAIAARDVPRDRNRRDAGREETMNALRDLARTFATR
jgi:ATP-dependent Clp protease, protease subunit